METLAAWDHAVFQWINQSWANPILDRLFPVLTDFDHWRVPVVIGFLLLGALGRGKGRVTVLLVVVGIALSDQTAAHLLKPLVGRTRPCNALENVRLLVPGSGAFSFPSAHAANMTSAALVLSVRYRRLMAVWISLAALVCLSRVYVGVHYPLDVVGGVVVGAFAALAVLGVHRRISVMLARRHARDPSAQPPQDPSD